MSNSHGSTKVVIGALAVNLAIAIGKGVASVFTGSSAMFAETIHSFVDCANQIFMLIGIKRSQRPATKLHPLGYHREIYFWSVVVSFAVFALGGLSAIYDGVHEILSPTETPTFSIWGHHVPGWTINIAMVLFAASLESQGFLMAYKSLRASARKGESTWKLLTKSVDPSLFVVMFEDGAALAGLTITGVATILVALTHNELFDAMGSILTGMLLAGVAFVMLNETRSLINGEASIGITNALTELVQAVPGVDNINSVITQYLGPDAVLALLSVDWDNSLSAEQVEQKTSRIHAMVRDKKLPISRLVIEARSAKDANETELLATENHSAEMV